MSKLQEEGKAKMTNYRWTIVLMLFWQLRSITWIGRCYR